MSYIHVHTNTCICSDPYTKLQYRFSASLYTRYRIAKIVIHLLLFTSSHGTRRPFFQISSKIMETFSYKSCFNIIQICILNELAFWLPEFKLAEMFLKQSCKKCYLFLQILSQLSKEGTGLIMFFENAVVQYNGTVLALLFISDSLFQSNGMILTQVTLIVYVHLQECFQITVI